MYEIIPYICAVVFIGIGLFMALVPSKSVKKESRDSKEEIKRVQRSGMIIVVAGIILFLINLM